MEILLAIQKDKKSVFGVTVPGIKGCFSWGDTIEDAISNTRAAIMTHLEASLEAGLDIEIQPVTIEQIRGQYGDAHYVFVDIEDRKIDTRPERINISLPRFVLEKIDRYVEVRQESRSGFLARAGLRTIEVESRALLKTTSSSPKIQGDRPVRKPTTKPSK